MLNCRLIEGGHELRVAHAVLEGRKSRFAVVLRHSRIPGGHCVVESGRERGHSVIHGILQSKACKRRRLRVTRHGGDRELHVRPDDGHAHGGDNLTERAHVRFLPVVASDLLAV